MELCSNQTGFPDLDNLSAAPSLSIYLTAESFLGSPRSTGFPLLGGGETQPSPSTAKPGFPEGAGWHGSPTPAHPPRDRGCRWWLPTVCLFALSQPNPRGSRMREGGRERLGAPFRREGRDCGRRRGAFLAPEGELCQGPGRARCSERERGFSFSQAPPPNGRGARARGCWGRIPYFEYKIDFPRKSQFGTKKSRLR